jgi:hypothetical protein
MRSPEYIVNGDDCDVTALFTGSIDTLKTAIFDVIALWRVIRLHWRDSAASNIGIDDFARGCRHFAVIEMMRKSS